MFLFFLLQISPSLVTSGPSMDLVNVTKHLHFLRVPLQHCEPERQTWQEAAKCGPWETKSTDSEKKVLPKRVQKWVRGVLGSHAGLSQEDIQKN